MTTRTREDLVLESLQKLGVLPDGGTPGIEDTTAVDEALDAVLAELDAREIVSVPDPDAVPLQWFMPIANIVAYECIEKFGLTGEEAATLQQRNEEAIQKLRVMNRGKYTGEPLRALYF